MDRKLYRSREDKVIAGVCSGMANYFKIDPTIVRIIVAILAFANFGTILIVYVVVAIITPERPEDLVEVEELDADGNVKKPIGFEDNAMKKYIGVALIGFGGMVLLSHLFEWFDSGILFAVGILAVGVYLLFQGQKE